MRFTVVVLVSLTVIGCATPGQPMSAYEQQQAAQAAALLLGGVGAVVRTQQAAQQQRQINAYNQAIIQQQQAGARILNGYADQIQQQNQRR